MTGTAPLEDRWDDAHAASLDEPGRLLYRSNLLGADKRITNYGGGNTSAKLQAKDPLTGEAVTVRIPIERCIVIPSDDARPAAGA